MIFSKTKLETYKTILATTEVQAGYQEFIRLFRFLRTELAKTLPEYIFSGHIVENNMDFAYFQLTDERLKSMGLKIQVVFIHAVFHLRYGCRAIIAVFSASIMKNSKSTSSNIS